ncbi:MAG: phage portal protein, partial [Chloroflexota bacterium]|nr:phage portal protein [Chloroflexota bacterium]
MPLPAFLRWLQPASTADGAAPRIQEQINPTAMASSPTQEDWYWGRLATGSEEDYFWRRLSDNWYQKDVIPSTYLELHNQCYEAYNANPLAFAIIEITTSFVMGKGVTVAAREPEVQRVLLDFWHEPDNHMETRVYDLCTELALYGEQFVRFFVNPYDGRVKVRQVDPSLIDQIET